MEASLINQWFSGPQINAICWTLIHSLWIGLVIALLCGIVIATTRKSTAALRYRLLCGLLVLFVCAIGVTYCLEARSASISNVAGYAQNIMVKAAANVVVNPVIIPQNQTFLYNVKTFLNQNINVIFVVWLLFFVLKSLKMVSGLLYIQRIRNYKVHEVAEEFKHKIEMFSSQIGIRQTVRLVQSELVKVPVAVGWLKPLILLPMGVILQLPAEQLDSILWHELAHIHRRDYLVNILQGLVETVFFFNPGLLWLSSLIRAEREACCDDIVLSHMNHKANYLEALLSFGYENNSRTVLAMSIGSGNQLRDRLKRMINQENKRLNMAEKIVLAAGLVLLLAFTTLPKTAQAARYLSYLMTKKSVAGGISKPKNPAPRPVPTRPRFLLNKPQQLVNDTIVKKTDTAIRFTSVLFKSGDADWANNDISAKDDKWNAYHFIVVDGKIVSLELNGVKVDENKLPGYDYTLQLIISELMEKQRIRTADDAGFKTMEPQTHLQAIKRQHMKDSLKVMRLPLAKYSADALPEPKLKAMKMQKRMHDDSVGYTANLKKMMNIISDLVKDKVVANGADVKWFGLSNTEFIVNGQKQSNEMQRRYKAKYGVHEGYGLYYGPVQMTGKGVFIDLTEMPPRPMRPQKPGPKYIGATGTGSQDSIRWKQQELIRQQALFVAKEEARRAQIVEQQLHLVEQQQRFAEVQNVKREHMQQEKAHQAEQQRNFAAEQNEKRAQLLQQQQAWLAQQTERMKQHWLDHDIDLQPAISGVITDLVSANVISDKSELSSFSLTNKALIVNGKKQAEDIHEKLKSKYLDRSAYPGNGEVIDWNQIKNDPNFGLHFDTNGGEGLGIMAKRYSQ